MAKNGLPSVNTPQPETCIPHELMLRLLRDIASGVRKLEDRGHAKLDCVEVVFRVRPRDKGWGIPLGKALDYLVNDTYYFEDFDIRQALSCEVRSM